MNVPHNGLVRQSTTLLRMFSILPGKAPRTAGMGREPPIAVQYTYVRYPGTDSHYAESRL